ncbi:hypothetical protein AVEN_64049-1 [Araneus ventricosus]|uniref:Fibronectin type-III domain-containing protein n=1 Tax=Araneus ventricosus TaxID=182803 RepID=A0A4Y2IU99_ARAVE|nr:hypothetical protein AVEN_64049-1 [Araneus ventricosus]
MMRIQTFSIVQMVCFTRGQNFRCLTELFVLFNAFKGHGYVLLYKSESGDVSEESHVAPQRNNVLVKNLKCGTKYHFFLTAFNNAGRGEPSEEVTARTKGGGNI